MQQQTLVPGGPQSLQFELPDNFSSDEVILSFRAPAPTLNTKLTLNKQLAVRSNLLVHRRMLDSETTIEMVCGEVCAELVSSIPSLENLASSRFEFADGAQGMLVLFDFAAGDQARVRQYQAMRLDGVSLSTLTLSVDGTTLDQAQHNQYLNLLSRAVQAKRPS